MESYWVAATKGKIGEIYNIGGNKTTTVNGIRAACKVMKTRYAKPFEAVQVKIPYETGMDPYSGLVDLFEAKGLLKKEGNRLKYVDLNGESHLEYRKAWIGDKLDMIMKDITNQPEIAGEVDNETVEENVELEPIKE